MHRLIWINFGVIGAALGIAAGLIELSIGPAIRPWIGDKENPVILGFVTLLLSMLALRSAWLSRRSDLSYEVRIAVVIGQLVPALVCFTTVGRLWYLAGPLLLIGTVQTSINLFRQLRNPHWLHCTAGLLILGSVLLAFTKQDVALYRGVSNEGILLARPMDLIQRGNTQIEYTPVLLIYVTFLIGSTLMLTGLIGSRLFPRIGAVVVAIGLIGCFVVFPGFDMTVTWQPGIGWYAALFAVAVVIIREVVNYRKTQFERT